MFPGGLLDAGLTLEDAENQRPLALRRPPLDVILVLLFHCSTVSVKTTAPCRIVGKGES